MAKDAAYPGDLVVRAVRAYGRVLNLAASTRLRLWDERGLTTGQLRVLFTLLHEGPLSASQLAARLQARPATMTGIADRLVRQNLIERRRHAPDRRVVLLALTDEGRSTLREVEALTQRYLAALLARVDAERGELFVDLLEELAEAAQGLSEAVAIPPAMPSAVADDRGLAAPSESGLPGRLAAPGSAP